MHILEKRINNCVRLDAFDLLRKVVNGKADLDQMDEVDIKADRIKQMIEKFDLDKRMNEISATCEEKTTKK